MKYLILLLLLVSCTFTPKLTILTEDKAVDVQIEVAETQAQQMQGLMNRTRLENNSGMLFVFKEQQPVSFWMKNTLIPLDMIFIDENYIINDIQQAVPCTPPDCSCKPACPNYSGTAMYVLEVNKDFCKNNDVKVGDRVHFSV